MYIAPNSVLQFACFLRNLSSPRVHEHVVMVFFACCDVDSVRSLTFGQVAVLNGHSVWCAHGDPA